MMIDVNQVTQFLPWLNVLMIPALAFVIRIDRRLGQHEVLHVVNDREHIEIKQRLTLLENQIHYTKPA
jgi:hypothetical protein